MNKKVLTLLLTILMSMVGEQAFADWDTSTKIEVNGLYYYLDNDNPHALVTSMSSGKYTGDIEIPNGFIYEGNVYSVTSIGVGAFFGCYELTSVIIPNSVTSIGEYAFIDCYKLTSVTIPNSVTSIGLRAFYSCSGLTSITIPNSVTSIGESAFNNCSGLTSVTIPDGVTSISGGAFYQCSGLTSITIPNSVTSIGIQAFYECSGLTSIIIGNSVTSIGNYAFSGCSGLTSITIPNSVTSIGYGTFNGCSSLTSITIPNSVTSIDNFAFENCSGLTSINVESGNTVYDSRDNCNAIIETASNELIAGCKNTIIPNSVTSIVDGAFYGCSGLTSVTIPNSVTSIGYSAFYGCSGLTSVTVLNPTPVAITKYVFTNRTNATLYVPQGSKEAYQAADYWKEFANIIEMIEDITIGAAGIGTYCSPHALDFSNTDDIKAYIVSAFKPSTREVTLTRITDVPGNTGIIVKGNADTYSIPYSQGETSVSNMLVGVTKNTILNKEDGANTNYILAKKNGVLGFYAVIDGSTLSAGKAYLPLPTVDLPSDAREMKLVFEDEETTTGIKENINSCDSVGKYYDLQGRCIAKPSHGLYIVNGKKVIIK